MANAQPAAVRARPVQAITGESGTNRQASGPTGSLALKGSAKTATTMAMCSRRELVASRRAVCLDTSVPVSQTTPTAAQIHSMYPYTGDGTLSFYHAGGLRGRWAQRAP